MSPVPIWTTVGTRRGLSAAKTLLAFGHTVTVFEKVGDVGGVWSASRSYPGVSTQNGKDTYCYSDFPMPKSYPEWPSGPQVQAYLESYANHFNLMPHIRLNTEVQSAVQGADNRWTQTSKAGVEDFDFLVVSNGIFSRPAIPRFDGDEAFVADGGRICHSSEFSNLDDAKGKHVLVIGYGKSSCDLATALADSSASLQVIAREIIWKAPKKFACVLNYKYLLLTRMGEALFKYIRPVGVEKFLHGVGRPLRKLGLVPRGKF